MTTLDMIARGDQKLSAALSLYAADIDERVFSLWYLSRRQPAAVIVEYVQKLEVVWNAMSDGDSLLLAQRNAIWEDIDCDY